MQCGCYILLPTLEGTVKLILGMLNISHKTSSECGIYRVDVCLTGGTLQNIMFIENVVFIFKTLCCKMKITTQLTCIDIVIAKHIPQCSK